jgi:hypothetical protein
MLSDLLNSLADHFAGWTKAGGVTLDARTCALLHSTITDAKDQAHRLEGAPVPPAAMALPAGVARLDDYRPLVSATGGHAA